ncbi:hypothetical protein AB0P17_15490 [Streptomyces sp. NPDC088124]|uniref:hypothetical protein n=1 Tax=Streptomyces sp. NPDC088124 TaxID=3154654 RepID=UPI00342D0C55
MKMTDPHHPYFVAVKNGLGDLYDPEQSWAEYASDGEVMLMEIVIQIAPDHVTAAGWTGLLLFWDQVHGWTWAYQHGDSSTSQPAQLLTGALVADPADVARATHTLLTPGGPPLLPIPGSARPHDGHLTPELERAVGQETDEDPGDIDRPDAAALAAYADVVSIRTLSAAVDASGLPDITVGTGLHCAVSVWMTPEAGEALGHRLGLAADAILPLGLAAVGIRTTGGAAMPHGTTLHLDSTGAARLAELLNGSS